MLNIYLSGEIHTDWREEIINLCKKENLDVSFSSPITNDDASDNCGVAILGDEESKKRLSVLNEKNDKIKSLQNKYTDSFSKNQSIKKESLKRNERIKTIETEIESWINLLSNSNKMINELTERKSKLSHQFH